MNSYSLEIETKIDNLVLLYSKHGILALTEEDAVWKAKKEAVGRLASYFEYVTPVQRVIKCIKQEGIRYEGLVY